MSAAESVARFGEAFLRCPECEKTTLVVSHLEDGKTLYTCPDEDCYFLEYSF